MADAGVLIIEAGRFRTQEKNREDAIERLNELVRKAGLKPKVRHKTRPSKASQEERLKEKRKRSKVEKNRGSSRDIFVYNLWEKI
jgi:ribosome-associated protein